jgi:hypothetical protein
MVLREAKRVVLWSKKISQNQNSNCQSNSPNINYIVKSYGIPNVITFEAFQLFFRILKNTPKK